MGSRGLNASLLAFTASMLALCVVLVGCTVNLSVNQEDSTGSGGEAETTTDGTSSSDSRDSQQASSSALSSDPSSDSSSGPSSDQTGVPSGYILDPNCEQGSGSTGLDIYYSLPPSDALRFACVHRVGTSPYLRFDEQFDQNLADVGGPYCAYSEVSKNVGCALTPIAKADLMNVPQPEGGDPSGEVPSGYVLEDCQQGTGATGKTIYYRPPLPPAPGGRMHTYWFRCVHPAGASAVVNVVSSPSSEGEPIIVGDSGPYCAYSKVSGNVGCALEPITTRDLMNPS